MIYPILDAITFSPPPIDGNDGAVPTMRALHYSFGFTQLVFVRETSSFVDELFLYVTIFLCLKGCTFRMLVTCVRPDREWFQKSGRVPRGVQMTSEVIYAT